MALLQEPCHSEGSIRRVTEDVRSAGYSPIWGSYAGGTQGSAPGRAAKHYRQDCGLVATLVKGRFAFPVSIPAGLQRWERRFQHVVYAYGRGERQLHLLNCYGFSGARQSAAVRAENEQFLLAVMRYADSLGAVPLLVVGDFNDEIDTSPVLGLATSGGRYVDLVGAAAQARGEVPPWTPGEVRGAARPGRARARDGISRG